MAPIDDVLARLHQLAIDAPDTFDDTVFSMVRLGFWDLDELEALYEEWLAKVKVAV